METTKTITVRFKESYMNHPVERTCTNMTREQVIDIYNLDDPDIEWYEFIRDRVMWYIEEWTVADGTPRRRILSEVEHRTLMCSSNVIFKSDDYNEVRKRYDEMTETVKSRARKEILERMRRLRDNSIERNEILTDLNKTLKKYEEILK